MSTVTDSAHSDAAAEGAAAAVGPSTKVGIIGTGMLGSAVAARLARCGYEVSVYNRTAQKTEKAEMAGAIALGSPSQVAEASDVIIIVVRDADAVRDVSFGGQERSAGTNPDAGRDGCSDVHRQGRAHGIVSGCGTRSTKIVVDMSTIGPSSAREIASEYKRHGIIKIDSPVMGGPDAAIAGKLISMVSGDRSGFHACRDILGRISEKVLYLGDEPGTANIIKLAMNMQITMLALSLAEGITFVERTGTDPRAFLDVLNATYFATGMSRKKAYNMINENQTPTFTLENLRKDIRVMTGVAESYGLELPMITAAQKAYDDALKNGHGHLDYTGIIRHVRKRGGGSSGSVDGDGENKDATS